MGDSRRVEVGFWSLTAGPVSNRLPSDGQKRMNRCPAKNRDFRSLKYTLSPPFPFPGQLAGVPPV